MLTLPRGPTESTQSWYANSRLGVYCCTLILWGSGVGKPCCHYFLSRCKEKSAPFSMHIFEYALKHLVDWRPVRDLCWWSDGGRHFRASVPISTMAYRGLIHLCSHSEVVGHNHTVDLNFGLASHFKNAADGAQASLKGMLSEAAKTEPTISTIPQMLDRCRAIYDLHVEGSRIGRMSCRFHDYFPEVERSTFISDFCVQFRSFNFKEPIGVCQSWKCRLNDKRLKKM